MAHGDKQAVAETVRKTKKKVSSKGKTYYFSFAPMIRITKAAMLMAKEHAKRQSISMSRGASDLIERGYRCLYKSSVSDNSVETSDDTGKRTDSVPEPQPSGSG